MAYFRCVGGVGGGAVLTLTYSSEFYGETITATNGTKTVTKVAPSTGTMEITLPESGTWVISSTVSGSTYTTTVEVDIDYTATLEAIPDGSTVLPTDDIQTWLKCAGIRDKTTYTTLSDVLGDTETFIALCADSNACDYMARSTNWASGVAADSTAMLIVGKYNYCANALLDNNTWETAIRNSPYSDYVNPDPSAGYIPLVPVMTSNTTPSGVASASSEYNSPSAYKAFDGDYIASGTKWQTTQTGSVTNAYLRYEFPMAKKADLARIWFMNRSKTTTYKIQGSNTGNFDDWTDLSESATYTTSSASGTVTMVEVPLTSSTNYLYYQLLITSQQMWSSAANCGDIVCVQFYAARQHTFIHSAVEDSIFYMDDGSPVALCGIPVGDTIDVDLDAYKGQTLTLVSTVAKDPTNLSNDFSMNVRITPNITEIYLMPIGVFYWYGSEVENNKGKSIASNLTDLSRVAPTVTRNKNTMVITEPNGRGEVYWNKYAGLVDAHVIYSATAQANPYTNAVLFSTTALPDHVSADWDDNYAIYLVNPNTSSVPLTHENCTIKDRTYIKAWMTNNSANAETVTLHALWLE